LKTGTPYLSKETELKLLSDYYRSGDLKILGKLYEPYMFLIYGLALKYLKDPYRSEDAVMHIFESLIKKLRIHRVTNFKSWLYTLAKNYCLMEIRAAHKKKWIIEEEVMESAANMHQEDGDLVLEDHLQAMEECVNRLTKDQQQCIRLFYLEEKCYKDISTTTGLSMKQVKSHIQNGRRNLKICMEKNK